MEDADVMIVMKPFKEWTSAASRAEMVEKMVDVRASLTDMLRNDYHLTLSLIHIWSTPSWSRSAAWRCRWTTAA